MSSVWYFSSGSKQYVLKISNSEFARGGLEMQNTMMNALHKAGMPVPRPVKRLCNGEMQGKDPNYIAQISGKILIFLIYSRHYHLCRQLGCKVRCALSDIPTWKAYGQSPNELLSRPAQKYWSDCRPSRPNSDGATSSCCKRTRFGMGS